MDFGHVETPCVSNIIFFIGKNYLVGNTKTT